MSQTLDLNTVSDTISYKRDNQKKKERINRTHGTQDFNVQKPLQQREKKPRAPAAKLPHIEIVYTTLWVFQRSDKP
jgi:hypothetical protein